MSIPTLGVHLIIYNEEMWLGPCLEQIHSIADELIVVDTGSTDRSVEIAKIYGASVIDYPWDYDFAAARNAGLAHATTDWILVLDADEQVIAGQEEIKAYLQQAEEDISLIQMKSWTGQSQADHLLHLAPRLFRNRCSYMYEGVIHEQLVQQKKLLSTAQSISPLKVNHYGYLPEVMASKQKALRNLNLIQRALEQQPEDAFHIYNLGVTYCQLDDREKAKNAFTKALGTCPVNAPYRATLVRDVGKLLYADLELSQARALLLSETQRYPDYADLHIQLGLVDKEQGMLEEAYVCFEKAIASSTSSGEQTTPFGSPYITEAGANSYIPHTHMADIDKSKGLASRAEEHYLMAMQKYPGYLPAIIGLADLLQKEGAKDSFIQQMLLQPMDITNPEHLYKAAYALMSCGAYEAALSILPEQFISIRDEAWIRLCLIQTKREGAAIHRAQQLLEREMYLGQISDHYEGPDRSETENMEMNTTKMESNCSHTNAPYLTDKDPAVSLSDNAELELAAMDWAICTWISKESLSASFYDNGNVNRSIYLEMEQYLGITIHQNETHEPIRRSACTKPSVSLIQAAEKLAKRAAVCGQKQLINFMRKTNLLTPNKAADLLYKRGFRLEAAEQYLEQLASGGLHTEGMFHLAEYMYDRSVYKQSLALFENALTLSGDHERSRAGAAASCLQLAKEATSRMLKEGTARITEASFSTLAQDLAELTDSLKRMDDLGWRTCWNGQERRRGGVGLAEAE